MASGIRLFFDGTFSLGETIEIQANQSHYLKNVLRLNIGNNFNLFNGQDGEFLFEICKIKRNSIFATALKQVHEQIDGPDIWLLFAPIRRHRVEILIEKITELGVAKFIPVITEYTNISKLNIRKLEVRAIEAAEQSLRMTVPKIERPIEFNKVFEGWDPSRRLLVMDESAASNRIGVKNDKLMSTIFLKNKVPARDAIFVGPEGGFSAKELDLLNKYSFSTNINLGSQLLRSETAAIVALALWNEQFNITC